MNYERPRRFVCDMWRQLKKKITKSICGLVTILLHLSPCNLLEQNVTVVLKICFKHCFFLLSGLDFEYQDKQNQHIYNICEDPGSVNKTYVGTRFINSTLTPHFHSFMSNCNRIRRCWTWAIIQNDQFFGKRAKFHSANNIFILFYSGWTLRCVSYNTGQE